MRPSPSEQVNLGYLPGELFTDRPPNQEEYGYSSDDDIESHRYLAIASYAILIKSRLVKCRAGRKAVRVQQQDWWHR